MQPIDKDILKQEDDNAAAFQRHTDTGIILNIIGMFLISYGILHGWTLLIVGFTYAWIGQIKYDVK